MFAPPRNPVVADGEVLLHVARPRVGVAPPETDHVADGLGVARDRRPAHEEVSLIDHRGLPRPATRRSERRIGDDHGFGRVAEVLGRGHRVALLFAGETVDEHRLVVAVTEAREVLVADGDVLERLTRGLPPRVDAVVEAFDGHVLNQERADRVVPGHIEAGVALPVFALDQEVVRGALVGGEELESAGVGIARADIEREVTHGVSEAVRRAGSGAEDRLVVGRDPAEVVSEPKLDSVSALPLKGQPLLPAGVDQHVADVVLAVGKVDDGVVAAVGDRRPVAVEAHRVHRGLDRGGVVDPVVRERPEVCDTDHTRVGGEGHRRFAADIAWRSDHTNHRDR